MLTWRKVQLLFRLTLMEVGFQSIVELKLWSMAVSGLTHFESECSTVDIDIIRWQFSRAPMKYV